jgi:uncharacterized protein
MPVTRTAPHSACVMAPHSMRARLTRCLGAILLCSAPVLAPAASFDCAQARTSTEKQICADETLSALDERLGRHYRGALQALPDARECLREDQREWLRTRNSCTDTTCLTQTYLRRLAVLDGLQPGANTIADLELPHVPALAWIIPPAADEIAVPRSTEPTAMTTRVGKVVNEIETGGELLLVSDLGERIALTLLMTADNETINRLSSFARRDAFYTVRGALIANDAELHFDASRCVFISENPSPLTGSTQPRESAHPLQARP